jgi:phosphopantothenoylcysteine decarboxylase/phosphopantothenate--cysteine ligase
MDGDLASGGLDPNYQGRIVLLGVTGGIAAYKSVSLASCWTQRGSRVRVMMTPAATRFVTPLTFQSVTRQPVATDVWQAEEEALYRPEHIDLGELGAVFVVAPATADFLARLAHGLADDIVCLSLLAYRGPVLVAPAMNDKMWANPAVQANIETLRARSVQVIEPGVGHLACGSFGAGRLAPLDDIDRAVTAVLQRLPRA